MIQSLYMFRILSIEMATTHSVRCVRTLPYRSLVSAPSPKG